MTKDTSDSMSADPADLVQELAEHVGDSMADLLKYTVGTAARWCAGDVDVETSRKDLQHAAGSFVDNSATTMRLTADLVRAITDHQT